MSCQTEPQLPADGLDGSDPADPGAPSPGQGLVSRSGSRPGGARLPQAGGPWLLSSPSLSGSRRRPAGSCHGHTHYPENETHVREMNEIESQKEAGLRNGEETNPNAIPQASGQQARHRSVPTPLCAGATSPFKARSLPLGMERALAGTRVLVAMLSKRLREASPETARLGRAERAARQSEAAAGGRLRGASALTSRLCHPPGAAGDSVTFPPAARAATVSPPCAARALRRPPAATGAGALEMLSARKWQLLPRKHRP